MFDPDLWRRTKVTVIALIVVGACLLLPAAYVFLLTGILVSSGALDMVLQDEVASLFWSAVLGSASGCLAWITLCLLLFQRHSVRVHLIAWHVLRVAGIVLCGCTIVWLADFHADSLFEAPPGDMRFLVWVLLVIFLVSLLLVWFGHRHLRLARRSSRQKSESPPP